METGRSAYNNYNPDRGRHSFEIASLVMGVMSLILLCTGILSIPAGAMGVLFSILSKKGKNPLSAMARTAMILSLIGMISGAFITVYAVYTVMTDPSVIEEVKQMYARYGMEVPDYFEYLGEGGSL